MTITLTEEQLEAYVRELADYRILKERVRKFRDLLELQRDVVFQQADICYTPYRAMLADFYHLWPEELEGRASWNDPISVARSRCAFAQFGRRCRLEMGHHQPHIMSRE